MCIFVRGRRASQRSLILEFLPQKLKKERDFFEMAYGVYVCVPLWRKDMISFGFFFFLTEKKKKAQNENNVWTDLIQCVTGRPPCSLRSSF